MNKSLKTFIAYILIFAVLMYLICCFFIGGVKAWAFTDTEKGVTIAFMCLSVIIACVCADIEIRAKK